MSTVEEVRQGLLDNGYVEVEEHKGLKPGVRVRHVGHQYPRAFDKGTGTVRHVLVKDPSSWAQSNGRPDVEVVVEVDPTVVLHIGVAQWADYHCVLAYEQPEEAGA